jgi:hypothetical protein
MLTKQENSILQRARRNGAITVAWFSEAEEACKTLVGRGYLELDKVATNRFCLVQNVLVYRITEEGKRG